MGKCTICGKQTEAPHVDKCLKCSREALQKMFKEDPELSRAFVQCIQEMRKPENMKPIVDATVRLRNVIQEIRKGTKDNLSNSEK